MAALFGTKTTRRASSLSKTSAETVSSDCFTGKAVKLELVEYDSLPEFLRDNEFIVSYYRSEWPLKQTVLSIFSMHNETLNIWTHLIGFFIMLMLASYAVSVFPVSAGNVAPLIISSNALMIPSTYTTNGFYRANHTTEPSSSASPALELVSRWPFYLFLAAAMFCLLLSSAYHLLSCHSSGTNYVMLRLDFAGICGLIVSSFYPLVYYSFACSPFYRNLYLSSITAVGLATALVSLLPFFDTPQFRPVRALLFSSMGVSSLVPIMHKMIAFGHRPEAVLTTQYEAAMGTLSILGALVYAMRVPERWLPGRFDLIGHSHQLFHLLVVAAVYSYYRANLVYLQWREVDMC